MKNVTIGRDERCDIQIPLSFETVSNMHADIEENNGKLYFYDHSSNGSIINGQRIKHTKMEIKYGDDIKLSNAYLLTWKEIMSFFPDFRFPTIPMDMNGQSEGAQRASRPTQMHNTPVSPLNDSGAFRRYNQNQDYNRNGQQSQSNHQQADIDKARKGWNWGAFLLGWIWGVGHSCWWPLLVSLGMGFFCGILMLVAPIVGFVIYSLAGITQLAIAVYLGAKGNSIGWDNGCYENYEHFKSKEKKWTIAGLIVLGVYALGTILILVSVFSLLSSL